MISNWKKTLIFATNKVEPKKMWSRSVRKILSSQVYNYTTINKASEHYPNLKRVMKDEEEDKKKILNALEVPENKMKRFLDRNEKRNSHNGTKEKS